MAEAKRKKDKPAYINSAHEMIARPLELYEESEGILKDGLQTFEIPFLMLKLTHLPGVIEAGIHSINATPMHTQAIVIVEVQRSPERYLSWTAPSNSTAIAQKINY